MEIAQRRICSPRDGDAVIVENRVMRHKRQRLELGLGDEHPIEWIAVRAGELPRVERTSQRYRKDVETLFADVGREPLHHITWFNAMSEFISQVNGYSQDGSSQTGFAGYTDWRMPTGAELKTILPEAFSCGTDPCIDEVFGRTQSHNYWSATSDADFPSLAWLVYFGNGGVYNLAKSPYVLYVRAVRGGS